MTHFGKSYRYLAGLLLASGGLLVSGCGVAEEDGESSAFVAQSLEPLPPGQRRDIHDLSPSERAVLASAILDYITQPVIDEHSNAHDWHHPADGELFFIRHHEYLNKLETYLIAHGVGRFVPLPEWDPGTTIPDEFLVADELVRQTPMNPNPNKPLPAEFNDLCSFPTLSDLAVNLENWHDGVHGAVGGAMAPLSESPGTPIFWLWHGFLDNMYHGYEWQCEGVRALPRIGWMTAASW